MQAVHYRTSTGKQPVEEFIDNLSAEVQAKLYLEIDRLNMLGAEDPPLPFPLSSQVDGELRELRCHYGRILYRILYRRSRNFFVLLHILQKNGRALPRSDIDIANGRWEDFVERMNANPRRPPRAIGHDVPS